MPGLDGSGPDGVRVDEAGILVAAREMEAAGANWAGDDVADVVGFAAAPPTLDDPLGASEEAGSEDAGVGLLAGDAGLFPEGFTVTIN